MMQRSKKGVLLVNLGTPNSPAVPDVRKYLDQFLMDGRVIDIPYWRRALLVKGIITTFRSPKSAKLYQAIWRENGSPLLHYSVIQQKLLQEQLGNDYIVELAMRYQSPSIAEALERLRKARVQSLQVIPLFPQYASASSGSVVEMVMQLMQSWHTFPKISIAGPFYDNEHMIAAFAENAAQYHIENFDHLLFSYHGLPVRQLVEVDPDGHHNCEQAGCRLAIHEHNQFCYVAQCYATTRLIAEKLGLQPENYTVCFQSRLGKTPWVKPYTSDVLKILADQGKKKLLTFCPAFVADCLETLYEVSVEYHELFRTFGGEQVQLVESLNDHPLWITALKEMVLE
ncbi:ferrochelatase [bacterium A37T11]|nr:ferrochelatase [bacterium A37T11]